VGLPLPIIFQWHVTCHFGNSILSRTRNDRDTDTIRQRSCLFISGQSTDLEFFWRYLAWFGGRGRGRLCRWPRPGTRGAEAGGQYEKLQPVSACCWLQLLEMYWNWNVCFLWLVLQQFSRFRKYCPAWAVVLKMFPCVSSTTSWLVWWQSIKKNWLRLDSHARQQLWIDFRKSRSSDGMTWTHNCKCR